MHLHGILWGLETLSKLWSPLPTCTILGLTIFKIARFGIATCDLRPATCDQMSVCEK